MMYKKGEHRGYKIEVFGSKRQMISLAIRYVGEKQTRTFGGIKRSIKDPEKTAEEMYDMCISAINKEEDEKLCKMS